eukprot:11374000-Prorocentrum_lima.AAC.1
MTGYCTAQAKEPEREEKLVAKLREAGGTGAATMRATPHSRARCLFARSQLGLRLLDQPLTRALLVMCWG